MVHGDQHLLVTTLYEALVVERCIGARIVDDAKLFQRQRERQMLHLLVFVEEGGFGHVRPEPYGTSAGKEVRGQRSCQYHHKRHMQQHHRHALVEPLLHHIGQGSHRKHSPQRREPPGAVNVVANKVRTTVFLYDSGNPYTRHDERIQGEDDEPIKFHGRKGTTNKRSVQYLKASILWRRRWAVTLRTYPRRSA